MGTGNFILFVFSKSVGEISHLKIKQIHGCGIKYEKYRGLYEGNEKYQ